jgi:small subunit ribosomal protein S17
VTVNEMTDEATTDAVDPDAAAAAEGRASDEADAARGESAADDEPAIVGDEPAVDGDESAATDEPARRARKVREGLVVSDRMDKTAVVEVVDRVRHAKYNKFVLRTKKLYAHDETNDVNVGDKVRVMETRPLSKSKRWRITEVLERAK